MLKKIEIELLSKRIGWTLKTTKLFLDEIYNSNSFIAWVNIRNNSVSKKDLTNILKIFLYENDQREFNKKCIHYFRESFNDNLLDSTVFFLEDEGFPILLNFLANLNENHVHDSFYLNGLKNYNTYINSEQYKEDGSSIFYFCENCLVTPNEAEDWRSEIIDCINSNIINESIDIKAEYYSQLTRIIGFGIFKIKIFRDYIFENVGYFYHTYYNIAHDALNVRRDRKLLFNKLVFGLIKHRQNINKVDHWLCYLLVEELKKRGLGTSKSEKFAGEYLGIPPTTVHRRYYDKKKEIKENNINIIDIISEYRLQRYIRNIRHTLIPSNI